MATTSAAKMVQLSFLHPSSPLQRVPFSRFAPFFRITLSTCLNFKVSLFITSITRPSKGPNWNPVLVFTLVLGAAGRGVGALAVLLVVLVFTLVLVAVGPGVGALAVHLVVLPATLVLVAASIAEGALAISEVVLVFTLVHVAAGIGVGALAVPLAVLPLTLVDAAVCPEKGPLAVFEVVLVSTLVQAVGQGHGALAVPLAVLPLTFVDVTVGPDHDSLAVSAISDARGFHSLVFRLLFVPASLQRRASSAPHRHGALCMHLQPRFYC